MNATFNHGRVFFNGTSRVGIPKEARVLQAYEENKQFPSLEVLVSQSKPVHLGDGAFIGNGVTIYEGTSLGAGTVLEDHVRIGFDCKIGPQVRIMYGAFVCDRVCVGTGSRIAGLVGDASRIGDNCTVMGNLVHRYTQPDAGWGDIDEPAPIVRDDAIVGYGATIIGGVEIGAGSYITAGAVVSKSVPAQTIVIGTNQHFAISEWKGKKLREFFDRRSKHDAAG